MSGARRQPSEERDIAVVTVTAVAVAVVGGALLWVTTHLAAAIAGRAAPPNNPAMLVAALVHGETPWGSTGWLLLAGQLVILALLAAATAVTVRQVRGARVRGDRAAALMGTGRDVAVLSGPAARATADRLGVAQAPGLPIARTVAGGQTLWHGWEDVAVDIWGPRQGKTTARVIPAIAAAPGPVVVTSNKRDVLDATRMLRRSISHRVWVFDPQAIAGEPPTWWWNPIDYVTGELAAAKLAHTLVTAARPSGARVDAFFDTAGEELLAGLLLAASAGRRPMTDVYLWLTRPTDTEPAILLGGAGYTLTASAVRNHIDAPDKQRDGVFGTARTMVRFMTNPAAMAWVTPGANPGRPRFDPAAFVRDPHGTIYLLSKEGEGSTGPIMTALTVAISEAAETYSQQCPGGRLPVPMLLALDEAANICRWTELPNLYSHFGSRGIVAMTILQSWAQGEEVWGRAGMTKLWAAATVKVVGSGVGGGAFLNDLSALIGDWQAPAHSYQSGSRGHGPSHTRSRNRERIMDVADIAALPRGRAIVIAAGARPALCRVTPWMAGPHADAISRSLDRHGPRGARPDRREESKAVTGS